MDEGSERVAPPDYNRSKGGNIIKFQESQQIFSDDQGLLCTSRHSLHENKTII